MILWGKKYISLASCTLFVLLNFLICLFRLSRHLGDIYLWTFQLSFHCWFEHSVFVKNHLDFGAITDGLKMRAEDVQYEQTVHMCISAVGF